MIDWTLREQPELACTDRPMTGYDDFGNIIFFPPRHDDDADATATPLYLWPVDVPHALGAANGAPLPPLATPRLN